MSNPPMTSLAAGPDVGVGVLDEPGAEVFASVSLRELQVALQAARASQLARPTAPLATHAVVPVEAADGSRRRGVGGRQTGGASRTGGRLAPPPAGTTTSSLVLLAAHGGPGADCLVPPPVMTHPARWRLDQLLAWEDRRIAAAESPLAELPASRSDRLEHRLPAPKRPGRKSA